MVSSKNKHFQFLLNSCVSLVLLIALFAYLIGFITTIKKDVISVSL